MRRGRPTQRELRVGDALDFWRVEAYEPDQRLRLRAEMKVPGSAWLQWEAESEGGKTRLVQSALFAPKGFLGWIYWHGVYPIHAFIFDDLVDAVAARATGREAP